MKRYGMAAAIVMSAMLNVASMPMRAQSANPATPSGEAGSESKVEREIRELREQLRAQQLQIDALQAELAGRKSAPASDRTTAAAAPASQPQPEQAPRSASNDAATQPSRTAGEGSQAAVVAVAAPKTIPTESPTALYYKGITIKPVAFFAFEGVWRQHATNSDINTPFNSIPFPNAAEGHVSELNFTGRQSRLGGLFEANAGSTKLSGYVETDFLGAGVTSNNNESNSYVLRVRQVWGRAVTATGFGVSGGQMWSLTTTDAKGTENGTEKIPNTVDPQYLVGFTWTRQPGLRVWQRWGDPSRVLFTGALSIEQAQITNFTVNGVAPANYFFSAGGTSGGLYNAAANPSGQYLATYTNNVAPDVVLKGAVDAPKMHAELGGIARWLRDFYNPVSVVNGAYVYDTTHQAKQTKFAGGIFGSVRVTPRPFVDLGISAMAGDGVGRYGSSQLADATLRPDETLEPLRNYHGLASVETHPAPKLDVYFYYGGEYAQRTVYANGLGGQMGYGIYTNNNGSCYNAPVVNSTTLGSGSGGSAGPSACGGPTRYIQEAMGGLTYRAIDSLKWGRLQYQLTYSYVQRNLWSGIGSATTPSGPRATEPMVHVSMRYIIP